MIFRCTKTETETRMFTVGKEYLAQGQQGGLYSVKDDLGLIRFLSIACPKFVIGQADGLYGMGPPRFAFFEIVVDAESNS